MQLLDGRLVYSATDLNNYLECGHLVALERSVALHERSRPAKDPTVELLARKGLEHERGYLERLRGSHPGLVEIAESAGGLASIERASARTAQAMASGASVIYQGTFFDGTFLGKADFLLRVETPSAHWPWSYEVADTKLALHDKPYFIVQLAHYSEHVARVQGTAPEHMHVILGSGESKTYRADDFAAYYRRLKVAFLERGATADAYPFACSHCAICSWSDACTARRFADDHLTTVAWMRRDQANAFEAAGVGTLAALAQPDAPRPSGLQATTFERLRRQASLQARGRASGAYHYELLDHVPSSGFGLLPEPAVGDVFFDMEGDQFYEIGVGLEYLLGCYCPDDERPFTAFWGTDRAAEKRAFEACIDFLIARRKQYPKMHVYHYAPYEKTALRKLWMRHDTREEQVDLLLRGEVLVDLYAVVRQTLAISQSSYSIKKLEPFYGMTRTADVRKGDDSIIRFEEWLREPEQRILDDIERYNEEDCRSTWMLREWLLARRAEYARSRAVAPAFRALRDPDDVCHEPPDADCKPCTRRVRDAVEQAKISADGHRLAARDSLARLLAHVLSYHRREDKPAWWAFFDRCDNVDGLVEFDREAIGGLRLRHDIAPEHPPRAKNTIYTYSFPEQLYHLRDAPADPATKKGAGEIVAIDEDANTLRLKRAGTLEDAAALSALIPGGPRDTKVQRAALGRVGAAYLEGTLGREHPAALDLLGARTPRLRNRPPGARIQPDTLTPEAVLEVVRALDRSFLFIQGPPGTGKTYTGARVIAELLRARMRVGVMANGHKAIHNMLHAIEAYALETGIDSTQLRGLHKHSVANAGSPYVSNLALPYVVSRDDNAAAAGCAYSLVSGNSWLFARPDMVNCLDYLFIDEAGQTSLADAIAVAPCANNVVLLGDPMQLAQVSLGSHPENAGRSVLQHLLGTASTVAPERGILLDISYRMAPAICTFISQTSYEGRLHADPRARNNRVVSEGLAGSGLRFIAVEHRGNGRESIEEAATIAREIELLLQGTFVRKEEPEAPLTERDILVVTPYNAQRKRIEAVLAAAGRPGVRVGTVDKFQGQEAPVVFYSLATSSGDDVPRNLEFLFERNRFNVAVSRAQCLSVLVCSPALLEVRCTNAEQLRSVNVLCRYVEEANRANRTVAALV